MSTRLITVAFLLSEMALTSAVAISVRTISHAFFHQWEAGVRASRSVREDISELIAGIWERKLNLPLNLVSCYLYQLRIKSDTQHTLGWVFSVHTDITYRWWKARAQIASADTSPLFRARLQKQYRSFVAKWNFRACYVKQLAGDIWYYSGLSCTVRGLEFHVLCLHIFSSFSMRKD